MSTLLSRDFKQLFKLILCVTWKVSHFLAFLPKLGTNTSQCSNTLNTICKASFVQQEELTVLRPGNLILRG